MIIRCATCSRDPIGRWKEKSPAIVFIDRHQTGDGSHTAAATICPSDGKRKLRRARKTSAGRQADCGSRPANEERIRR